MSAHIQIESCIFSFCIIILVPRLIYKISYIICIYFLKDDEKEKSQNKVQNKSINSSKEEKKVEPFWIKELRQLVKCKNVLTICEHIMAHESSCLRAHWSPLAKAPKLAHSLSVVLCQECWAYAFNFRIMLVNWWWDWELVYTQCTWRQQQQAMPSVHTKTERGSLTRRNFFFTFCWISRGAAWKRGDRFLYVFFFFFSFFLAHRINCKVVVSLNAAAFSLVFRPLRNVRGTFFFKSQIKNTCYHGRSPHHNWWISSMTLFVFCQQINKLFIFLMILSHFSFIWVHLIRTSLPLYRLSHRRHTFSLTFRASRNTRMKMRRTMNNLIYVIRVCFCVGSHASDTLDILLLI